MGKVIPIRPGIVIPGASEERFKLSDDDWHKVVETIQVSILTGTDPTPKLRQLKIKKR